MRTSWNSYPSCSSRQSAHSSASHPLETWTASIPFTYTVGVTWTPALRWLRTCHLSACVTPTPLLPSPVSLSCESTALRSTPAIHRLSAICKEDGHV